MTLDSPEPRWELMSEDAALVLRHELDRQAEHRRASQLHARWGESYSIANRPPKLIGNAAWKALVR